MQSNIVGLERKASQRSNAGPTGGELSAAIADIVRRVTRAACSLQALRKRRGATGHRAKTGAFTQRKCYDFGASRISGPVVPRFAGSPARYGPLSGSDGQ